jgi:arylsulfatase A-like enzyme
MTLLLVLWACSQPASRGDIAKTTLDTSAASTPPASTPVTLPTVSTTVPYTHGPFAFTDGHLPANVLILSIDTLRRDHLGRWGTAAPTPFLDGLVSQGVVLDDHTQCANWTYASMTCTTLGRPGLDLDWVPELGGDVGPVPAADTLAGAFRDAGYFTLVNSLNSWFSEEWNSVQGFDVALSTGGGASGALAAAADELAWRAPEAPWLLHVHVKEPHVTYAPPPSYLTGLADLEALPWDLEDHDTHYDVIDGQWPTMEEADRALLESHLRVRYAGEVAYLDDQLEEAFAALQDEGLLADTLVVVFSDHGESFWEHGHQTHAHTLHAEENDGIGFFWAQDLVPAGWSGPTHAVDLAATLLDLYGIGLPEHFEGIPVGQAPAGRARFHSAMARQGTVQSVLHEGFKLHFQWNTGVLELYDRHTDPAERSDLYALGHPRVSALWALLRPEVVTLSGQLGREPTWPFPEP